MVASCSHDVNNLIFSRPTTAGLQHTIPLFYLPALLVQPSISTLRVSKAFAGCTVDDYFTKRSTITPSRKTQARGLFQRSMRIL